MNIHQVPSSKNERFTAGGFCPLYMCSPIHHFIAHSPGVLSPAGPLTGPVRAGPNSRRRRPDQTAKAISAQSFSTGKRGVVPGRRTGASSPSKQAKPKACSETQITKQQAWKTQRQAQHMSSSIESKVIGAEHKKLYIKSSILQLSIAM